MPVQAPDHLTNSEPASALWERETLVSSLNWASQVAPQSIPAGVEVTLPVPVPVFLTLRANLGVALRLNSAVTSFAVLIVTSQTPVPVQAPLHSTNSEPGSALWESVTLVPSANLASQVAPQSTPAGVEVTLPVPVPTFLTLRAKSTTGLRSNLAVTSLAADIVTSQTPVPVQAPLHSTNSEPGSALWESVTLVPSSNSFSHSEPQTTLGETGEVLSTLPVPVPVFLTLRANLATRLKVAVTSLSAVIVKLQGEVEQAVAEPVPELKPANLEPASATATRASSVPSGYSASQASAEPPLTLHSTSPSPAPARLTVSGTAGLASKTASTVLSSLTSTSHSLPAAASHSPSHSTNSEPGSASARRVTTVPSTYSPSASHSSAELSNSHSTLPLPLPPSVSTVRTKNGPGSKLAVTLSGSSTVSSHSASSPEQSPPHSRNWEPSSASA